MLTGIEIGTHEYIEANGIRFHYITEGTGPLILLLHGFPENHYAWRYQMSALSKNHKVVAPDLRGYHLTDHQGPYDIKTLCKDIFELIHNLGYDKAIIVGHDWGSLITWSFAIDHPDCCEKLISLNVPYFPRGPKPLHELLTDERFNYMRDFQNRGEAEAIIEADIDEFIKKIFENYSARKNFMSEADLKFFADALRGSGNITPPLEYYRHLKLNWELTENHLGKKIKTPTLMIVADQDPLLTPEMSLGIQKHVLDVTIKHIDCGHWTQQEAPDETNTLILEFLNE